MHDDVFIPVVAILMPLLLVLTVMLLRQSARRREWLHRERMKAMERGIPVPGADVWSGRTAIAVGAVMPLGIFTIGWLANMTTGNDSVWAAVGLVAIVGVYGGIRLAGRQLGSMAQPAIKAQSRRAADDRGTAKPAFDPDAYDAIARHA